MDIKNDNLEIPNKRDGSERLLVAGIVALVLGLLVLAYPIVTDWYASKQANDTVTTLSSAYEPLSDPARLAVLDNARAYNSRLAGEMYDSSVEIKPYTEQMLFKNIEQMAWVEVRRAGIKIPIYHGTSDAALAAGVGHIEGTSLPIGGSSSHCVLTGHSGMMGERMFDDIRKLEVGDTFVLHSLGEPYAYKVYDIETVLPDETENLKISPGRDLCTLVTCTPYGVNSHRLLVHGERCDYVPEEMSAEVSGLELYLNSRTIPFIVAAIVVVGVIVILLVVSRSRKKRKVS